MIVNQCQLHIHITYYFVHWHNVNERIPRPKYAKSMNYLTGDRSHDPFAARRARFVLHIYYIYIYVYQLYFF